MGRLTSEFESHQTPQIRITGALFNEYKSSEFSLNIFNFRMSRDPSRSSSRLGTSVSRYDSGGRIPESLKKLPSEAAKNTKSNLIQKISQDNDMVRQEMAAMVQANRDLQEEVSALKNRKNQVDRLVIEETLDAASADEIAEKWVELKAKYSHLKEENDSLKHQLHMAKTVQDRPVSHAYSQPAPGTAQDSNNMKRLERIIQDQDVILSKLEALLGEAHLPQNGRYKSQIDELYNLTRMRPRLVPNSAPQARAITAGPAPAATALESIFERETKRNEKLERDLEQLTIEHRNEREQLIREIRKLKESERLAREAAAVRAAVPIQSSAYQ